MLCNVYTLVLVFHLSYYILALKISKCKYYILALKSMSDVSICWEQIYISTWLYFTRKQPCSFICEVNSSVCYVQPLWKVLWGRGAQNLIRRRTSPEWTSTLKRETCTCKYKTYMIVETVCFNRESCNGGNVTWWHGVRARRFRGEDGNDQGRVHRRSRDVVHRPVLPLTFLIAEQSPSVSNYGLWRLQIIHFVIME